jgi:hypothetical protein
MPRAVADTHTVIWYLRDRKIQQSTLTTIW